MSTPINRITGLASGMDTEALIKKLMDANRAPLNKLMQRKQALEWQRDDYRTLNNKILEFRNASFDMKLSSNYTAKKAASSKESTITASPTAAALDGVYQLTVDKLAKGSRLNSASPLQATGLDETVGSIHGKTLPAPPAWSDPTLLRIAGEKGSVEIVVKPTDKLSEFLANVNNQTAYTGIQALYDSTLDRIMFSTTGTGSKANIELSATNQVTGAADTSFLNNFLKLAPTSSGLTGEAVTSTVNFMTTPDKVPDLTAVIDSTLTTPQVFRVNYKGVDYNFTIDNTTTIGTLIGDMNASGLKTSGGVTAGLDGVTGGLRFTGISNGEQISFTDQTPDIEGIIGKLGLFTGANDGPDVVGSVPFQKQPPDFADMNKKVAPNRFGSEEFTVTFDGVTSKFTIDANITIGTLIKQINNSEIGKKGVSARLDSTTGELILTSPDSTKHLSFGDADNSELSGALKSLGLTAGSVDGDDFTYDRAKASGSDAEVWFNGVKGVFATNTFTIAGINFTAKAEDPGTPVNITVSQDVDTVFNKIKSFVDKYNELIDAVNKKIDEKKDRNYLPLTDAQRDEMSEDEIKNWEAKARQGTLSRDSLLSNGLYQLRQSLGDSISGLPANEMRSLAELGISSTLILNGKPTGSSADKGKLYIDEAKLKAAISDNPDQVLQIFNIDDGDSATSAGDGIAVRLYDKASALFSQISDKAGLVNSPSSNYLMGKDLDDIDKRVRALNSRLIDMEDRYYRQFGAMESYLNQMNAQSAWLMQQFGG